MLDFITVPAVIGIITLGFYKLFELFVRKRERLTIIEKLGEKFTPDMLRDRIDLSFAGNPSFSALKFGCLFMGIGTGLLVAFFIHNNNMDFIQDSRRVAEVVYGSCVLLFGGLGLLTAFLVELKINKNK